MQTETEVKYIPIGVSIFAIWLKGKLKCLLTSSALIRQITCTHAHHACESIP